jgi:hypothetical protein
MTIFLDKEQAKQENQHEASFACCLLHTGFSVKTWKTMTICVMAV